MLFDREDEQLAAQLDAVRMSREEYEDEMTCQPCTCVNPYRSRAMEPSARSMNPADHSPKCLWRQREERMTARKKARVDQAIERLDAEVAEHEASAPDDEPTFGGRLRKAAERGGLLPVDEIADLIDEDAAALNLRANMAQSALERVLREREERVGDLRIGEAVEVRVVAEEPKAEPSFGKRLRNLADRFSHDPGEHHAELLAVAAAIDEDRARESEIAFEAGRQAGKGEGYEEGASVVCALWQVFRPNNLSGGSAEDLLRNIPFWIADRERRLCAQVREAVERNRCSVSNRVMSEEWGDEDEKDMLEAEPLMAEIDRIFGPQPQMVEWTGELCQAHFGEREPCRICASLVAAGL